MIPAPNPTQATGHPATCAAVDSPLIAPAMKTRSARLLGMAAVVAAFLAGCATPLPPAPPPAPAPQVLPPVAPEAVAPAPLPAPVGALSYAKSPRDYRRDAAAHLYNKNTTRIFRGRMPPLLYAVGTLQVDLDPRGMVNSLNWMRAPNHAPEVVAEIERTVRQAAPYPVAVNLGHVTYTDTWLWHKSGRFQLDTLTEGQDGEIPSKPTPAPAKPAARKKAEANGEAEAHLHRTVVADNTH